jgi:hypothetical protein
MWSLAQTYYYQPVTTTHHGPSAVFLLIYLIFIVAYVVAGWKVFEKAGEAGWKVLIPIYNTIIMLKIVGYSPWYILLFLVPIVNLIFAIMVAYRLAVSFGYGVGVTILEFIFGIGVFIMGFGEAKYLGPNGEGRQPAKDQA